MKWKEFTRIPNQLTLVRLLSVPVLWVLAFLGLKSAFVVVLAIAGITDFLDGFTARLFEQQSEFGKWFDSFADNIMSVSFVFWLWILLPELLVRFLVPILIIFGLFIISLGLGFIKYHKLADYHTYLGKASAVLLYFVVLYSLWFDISNALIYSAVLLGSLGLAEEIVITLMNKNISTHKKWLFG